MNDRLVTMKGIRFSWHRRNPHHFGVFLMTDSRPDSAFILPKNLCVAVCCILRNQYLHSICTFGLVLKTLKDCLRVEVKIGLRSGLRLFGKVTVRVRDWGMH